MYTVKQWIEMLEGMPQDAVVIVSSDSEGNSMSALSNGIATGYWIPNIEELVDEDEASTYTKKEKHKAILLYPER